MVITTLKEYWSVATTAYKMAFLTFIVLFVVGYIGYLHFQLWRAETNAARYKSISEAYKANASNLKDRLDLSQSNHQKTIDYYESLECINRKKGPLTDDELTGKSKPSAPNSLKPTVEEKKSLFKRNFF
jgi:predicted negative regulator of RcsB-dependent stress response